MKTPIRSAVAALALLLALPLVAGAETLVPMGASWRYFATGFPGAGWQLASFDDSAWPSGPAQLGYGDGDEATVVPFGPDPANKPITVYFRRLFTVLDPSQVANLRLRLLRDDAAVVYVNGIEVARANLSPGTVTDGTLAKSPVVSAHESFVFAFDVDPATLVPGRNTLAVEVHQNAPTSSDLSFDLELESNAVPAVVRGPYLQRGAPDSMVVCWRTDVATDARVWYGDAPGNLTATVDVAEHAQDHEVELTGLAPETTYYYAVGTTSGLAVAGDDADHSLRTSPPPGAARPTRVWVLGDPGTADANQAAVRDAYHLATGGATTDLVLLLGDNAYVLGTDSEYQLALFEVYGDTLRSTVAWSTRGNHEAYAADYFSIFSLPAAAQAGGLPSGTEAYYSFDHANVHFVCLDSFASDRSVGGAQWTWLQSDLAATDQEWIVAFWHHPPYSKGSHDSDTELRLVEMRENFLPLLEAGGVDLVLGGHSHSYERSYLIDGHYGVSATFDPATMVRDGGDGDPLGDGAYRKAVGPGEGTVYCVAGSSGKITAAPLDHPVMLVSLLELGSVVLEVDGPTLAVEFLDATGAVHDRFQLENVPPLASDTTELSLSAGGTQAMAVNAGRANGGSGYWILGSVTGTSPPVDLGGGVMLPLVPDDYTVMTLKMPFFPIFQGFLAFLDGEGSATAALVLPPGTDPSLAGITVHHAYFTVSTPPIFDFASNAVSTLIVP